MRWCSISISRRKKILFVLVAWGALCLIAEGAARIRLAIGERDHGVMYTWYRDKRLSGVWAEQHRDHPYLPYYPKVKVPDLEMPGLRATTPDGTKPDDVFRIFCLGGSTTWYGYPGALEEQLELDFRARGLRLEVINAADVSWTSAESLINFAIRCLPHEPDAVLVYHAVNDCWPAFGNEWRPDYSHWRKRLASPEPTWWDYLPAFLDHSAAFVQLRSWFEIPGRSEDWGRAMMRYIPDFDANPYHGVEPYRRNIRSLIAIAQSWDIPVFLATQVYNNDEPRRRLVDAVREVNDITRELSRESQGVELIDAARTIAGNNEIMVDICHFRRDRDDQDRLVQLFADSIRSRMKDLVAGQWQMGANQNAHRLFAIALNPVRPFKETPSEAPSIHRAHHLTTRE